jgi:hypothetical protein
MRSSIISRFRRKRMSRTTLHPVPEKGEIEDFEEYQNSHGSAPYIWNALCRKYLKLEAYYKLHEYCEKNEMYKLWDLAKDENVEPHHRLVLATTFDHVMVKRKNLPKIVKAFESFVADFPPGEYACSLPQQAEDLRKLYEDPSCYAVCWTQTSVSGDHWTSYDKCEHCGGTEMGHRGWDISKDEEHWFLFESKYAPNYQPVCEK